MQLVPQIQKPLFLTDPISYVLLPVLRNPSFLSKFKSPFFTQTQFLFREAMKLQRVSECVHKNPKKTLFLILFLLAIAIAALLVGAIVLDHSSNIFVFYSLCVGMIIMTLFLMICLWRREYLHMKRTAAMTRASGGFSGGGDFPISEDFLMKVSGAPHLFRYADLKAATNDFTAEIGRGGFGSVFRGNLADGKKVAVKRLHRAGEGVEEFVAEVTALASLNHSNLVRLHGLCVEDSRHLLVYEFMENGSLYDWLFQKKNTTIDWKTRYTIALQTARALAYLHEESTSSILHLDVKPQNILLDENFRAKVSDFGMAKLLEEGESTMMTVHVKGTPGYIAPEWFLQYGISAKTDVYSYGMVLLEMVCGRKVVDRDADEENWYLPTIALLKAREGNLEEIFDGRLKVSDEEAVEMGRVVKLALWCIQSSCGLRPTMPTVVGILEGSLEMLEPPLDQSLAFGPFVGNVDTSSRIDLQGICKLECRSSHQRLVLVAEK